MPRLELANHRTGELIYEGRFDSARTCIEQAAREGVCLDYADLRHANLAYAALDDVIMRHALLDHTNLTGANLSEADLRGTSFRGATLHGACLCFSSLQACDFEGSLFGGTDIAGSLLQNARFSMLSAFSLNFVDADRLDNCSYRASAGAVCPFSRPPTVVSGLAVPVVLMDDHLKIGNTVRTHREWRGETDDNGPRRRPDNSNIYTFFCQHEALLRTLIKRGNDGALHKESHAGIAWP